MRLTAHAAQHDTNAAPVDISPLLPDTRTVATGGLVDQISQPFASSKAIAAAIAGVTQYIYSVS